MTYSISNSQHFSINYKLTNPCLKHSNVLEVARQRLKQAKEAARKIKDDFESFQALLDIVKVEKQLGLEQVNETVRRIEDPINKLQALQEIKKVEESQIQQLLEEAIKASKSRDKDPILLRFALLMVGINIGQAKGITEKIKDPNIRDQALAKIAKEEAKKNPENARQNAREIEDPDMRDQALAEIAKEEAKKNPENARQNAREIEDLYWKCHALLSIAEFKLTETRDSIEGSDSIKEVEKIMGGLDDDNKFSIMLKIVGIEAKKNPERAREIAKEISDVEVEDQALVQIARAEAHFNPKKAKKTANSISHLYWKQVALFGIVKVEAPFNLESAKKTAKKIQNPYWKSIALLEIVRVENSLESAVETMKSIEDHEERSRALLEILIQAPLEQAREILKTYSSNLHTDHAHLAHLSIAQKLINTKIACIAARLIVPKHQNGADLEQILEKFLQKTKEI